MKKLNTLCVDAQAEVGASVQRDLEALGEHVEVINCDSSAEARAVLQELDNLGAEIALIICDQVMPVQNGVDFLIELQQDAKFQNTQTILLTGQATHEDTIRAINETNITAYINKPWTREFLLETVKKALARYVFKSDLDYINYLSVIDQEMLYRQLHS